MVSTVTREQRRDTASMARDLVNVLPALQERLADMVHACIKTMVRMFDIVHHLFGTAAVGRGEWLVPHRKDETIRIRSRVL